MAVDKGESPFAFAKIKIMRLIKLDVCLFWQNKDNAVDRGECSFGLAKKDNMDVWLVREGLKKGL